MNMKQINIKLNYFEFGCLYASIKHTSWDKMPRTLWLKLKIVASAAYFGHHKLNDQAKKDAERYTKELNELEGKESKSIEVKHERSIYLWESMCAVFSTKGKVKTYSAKKLLEMYVKRQIKMGRTKYVAFVRANPERALTTAKEVLKLRKRD